MFFACNCASSVEGVWGPAVQTCEVVMIWNNSYSKYLSKTLSYNLKAVAVDDGFGLPEEASAEKESEFRERTYIMVKPDGVQRGRVGDVVARFEAKGFQVLLPGRSSAMMTHTNF